MSKESVAPEMEVRVIKKDGKRKKILVAKPAKEIVEVMKNPPTVSLDVPMSQIDKLIEMALNKNLDLDRVEKLLQMKREEDALRAKKEFYAAFSKLQYSLPLIEKNRTAGWDHKTGDGKTEYKWADLDKIMTTVKPLLFENGMAVDWEQEEKDDGNIYVNAVIFHVGGHEHRGKPLKAKKDVSGKKNDIQSQGSTLKYLMRYTLEAILGITSASDDDDGMSSSRPVVEKPSSTSKVKFDDVKMNNAVEMILAGTKTVEQIKEQADLTPEQESALVKVEENHLKNKK